MALLGKFFGRTASEGAAYAFGVATGPVLAPATETIRQAAWEQYATRIPGVASLAAGVAQGQVPEDEARAWAKKQGFGDTAFSALIDVANVGPDVGQAMQAWRRGKLTEPEFRTVLKRHAIEDQWFAAIEALKAELLAPADLARAIHRGLIRDPGLLQGTLPAGVGNVPAYPVYDVDALTEAAGSGIDHDRLGVLVGLQGLPMGSHEAAQGFFRGVLTEDDYLRAIAEGNTRNEWADAIKEQSRQIPSPANYVAAFIRGWRTKAQAYAGAARHGMTQDDVDLLSLIAGRPVTTHQAFTGFIRGGRVDGENWNERETFRRAVIQSNIRPEWEPILWAQRYNYPPIFQTLRLLTSKIITPAQGREWLTNLAYHPDVVDAIVTGATGTATVTADTHVSKAQVQLWTTTHRSYLAGEITKTVARNALGQAGVVAGSITTVLGTWDAEKALIRAQLTPANVKKAFAKGARNNATGKAWTRDEALAALVELGYAPLAANDYLDIP